MPGPDHAFSLEELQLEQFVAAAHEARQAMGSPQRRLLTCEQEVRNVSRGSVVSAIDIPAGAILTPAMLTVKRPGGGIEPARIKDLIGAKALSDIPADIQLDWSMCQLAPAPILQDSLS